MKITFRKNSYNFTSGLSKKNIYALGKISPAASQKYFKTQGVSANFKNNGTYSVLNLLCSEILNRLNKSSCFQGLNFLSKPGTIRVFDKAELIKPCPDTFCTLANKKILKNEQNANVISLFFKNDIINIEEMNEIAQNMQKNHFISSDNFLSPVMHEWAHCLHFNYLYSKFNYNRKSVVEYLKRLKNMEFSKEEQEIISEYLGTYVYNGGKISPVEVMAEALNLIICSCLNKDEIKIDCNIDMALQKTPKELISLTQKVLDFE